VACQIGIRLRQNTHQLPGFYKGSLDLRKLSLLEREEDSARVIPRKSSLVGCVGYVNRSALKLFESGKATVKA
jgi:hypothetical protein